MDAQDKVDVIASKRAAAKAAIGRVAGSAAYWTAFIVSIVLVYWAAELNQ